MSDLLAIPVAPEVLFRPRLSLDDWIDGLQMRWIGDDGDFNVFVRHSIQSFHRCAQMVFHIAATLEKRSGKERNFHFGKGCNRFFAATIAPHRLIHEARLIQIHISSLTFLIGLQLRVELAQKFFKRHSSDV